MGKFKVINCWSVFQFFWMYLDFRGKLEVLWDFVGDCNTTLRENMILYLIWRRQSFQKICLKIYIRIYGQ